MKNWKTGEKKEKLNKKKENRINFFKKVKSKKIIFKIGYIFLECCILLNLLFLVNMTIKEKEYFNLFGISLFSMETNLMKPEISKNSLIIAKAYQNNAVEVKDNIAYIVNGKVRINKVVKIESIDGKIVYHTKSNSNYYIDSETISKNEIIGKVINHTPVLGILLKILQSKITTICICIFLVIKFLYNQKVYKNKMRRKVQRYHKMKNN